MADESLSLLLSSINDRLKSLENKVDDVDVKVVTVSNTLASHTVNEEAKQKEQTEKIEKLQEAFDTGKHVLSFIKWSAGVIATIAAIVVFFKEHITLGIK